MLKLLAKLRPYWLRVLLLAAITLADRAELHATEEDLEDIAAFVGQLEGVRTSVTIRELEGGECKLSVRTRSEERRVGKEC